VTPAPIRLKHPSGWFAAGDEVIQALAILSAQAFQLYLYLCLHAERRTGRAIWDLESAAGLLRCGIEDASAAMAELCQRQVCMPTGAAAVEITDRFWPYEKAVLNEPGPELASYLEQVSQMLLRPACVRCRFSAADERLAASFHRRGITLTQLQRAIWLGCARKYLALLKGQPSMLITSLHYFSGLVEEVQASEVGDNYWLHVQRKAEQMERRWIANRSRSTPEKPDE
jgi:hypothetical protein